LWGSGNGILIKAPDVVIEGFEITNCAIGIRTYGGPSDFGDLTIKNTEIYSNTQNGILMVHDIFNKVTFNNLSIHDNGQNGIGLSNNLKVNKLFSIKNSNVSNNGQHGLFVAGVEIESLSIPGSIFDGAKTNGFSGITIGTTASTIGKLGITKTSLSNNKGAGLSIVQALSSFKSIVIGEATIEGNKEDGLIFGGKASTDNINIYESTFSNNGWEDIALSGGWFGAFNVNSRAKIQKNNFHPSAGVKIYVGDAGSINNLIIKN